MLAMSVVHLQVHVYVHVIYIQLSCGSRLTIKTLEHLADSNL